MAHSSSLLPFMVALLALHTALAQSAAGPTPRRSSVPASKQYVPIEKKLNLPPESSVKPGDLFRGRIDPDVIRTAGRMTFKSVTPQQLKTIFTKRSTVIQLTDCVVHIGYCALPFAVDLNQRIKNASRGGEFCPGCTRAETLHQLQAILKAMTYYRDYYPDQWKRIEKRLSFIEDRI